MAQLRLWSFVDAVSVLSESHNLPGINAKNRMLGLDPAHTSHEKIHSNTSAVANGNQTNEWQFCLKITDRFRHACIACLN